MSCLSLKTFVHNDKKISIVFEDSTELLYYDNEDMGMLHVKIKLKSKFDSTYISNNSSLLLRNYDDHQ